MLFFRKGDDRVRFLVEISRVDVSTGVFGEVPAENGRRIACDRTGAEIPAVYGERAVRKEHAAAALCGIVRDRAALHGEYITNHIHAATARFSGVARDRAAVHGECAVQYVHAAAVTENITCRSVACDRAAVHDECVSARVHAAAEVRAVADDCASVQSKDSIIVSANTAARRCIASPARAARDHAAVVGDAVYFVGNVCGPLTAVAQRENTAASDHDDGAAARARENIAIQAQRHRARNSQVCRQRNVGGKIVIAARKRAAVCGERRPACAVSGVAALRRVRRSGIAGQKNGERQSRAQRKQCRKQPQEKFASVRSVFHAVSPF